MNISGALEMANRFEEALAVAQAGMSEMEVHGLSQCDSVFLRTHLADALFELGRWDEVEEQLREVAHMDAVGIDAMHRDDGWFRLLLHRGDVPGAEAVFTRMADYAFSAGARQLSPYFEGSLAIAKGDVAGSVTLLEKWRSEFDDRDCSLLEEPDWFISEVLTAVVDAGAGTPDAIAQAEALVVALDETLPPDPRLDAVRPHRPALRAQARAELARARGEHDPEVWAGVAKEWEACNRPPHVAYARWRQGEAALRAGLGAEAATAPLRVAFELADAIGIRPIRTAVLDLAARGRVDLGVDPDATRDRAAASSGLTAREIEVIGLVARGRTNRQIADELFISVKTASVHVSNILMKLDAQNRVEAAARARDLGLVA